MADYAEDTLNKFGAPVSNFTSSIQPRRAALNAGAQADTQDYLSRFRQAIMGQEGLPHMYRRIGDELNLPNLATNFNQVANTMTNLPETYSKASRGMDVNASQLGRIISTKQAALAPALTTATQNYQTAQAERDKMVLANQAEQQKQLQPFADEKSFMAEKFARESTGFTADNSTELNGLIAKMQSGVQLSEGEKARANALSIAEKGYANALKIAQMQSDTQRYVADRNPLGL